MEVEIVTNMGIKTSIQDFLILENDAESLVIGVQWHTSLVGERWGVSFRMVIHLRPNYRILWNRLKIKLRKINYWMMPQSRSKGWSLKFFDPDFPDQKLLKSIVQKHGQVIFQPFDQEGLRVDSLHLVIDANVTFRMPPCWFIRSDILVPSESDDRSVCE